MLLPTWRRCMQAQPCHDRQSNPRKPQGLQNSTEMSVKKCALVMKWRDFVPCMCVIGTGERCVLSRDGSWVQRAQGCVGRGFATRASAPAWEVCERPVKYISHIYPACTHTHGRIRGPMASASCSQPGPLCMRLQSRSEGIAASACPAGHTWIRSHAACSTRVWDPSAGCCSCYSWHAEARKAAAVAAEPKPTNYSQRRRLGSVLWQDHKLGRRRTHSKSAHKALRTTLALAQALALREELAQARAQKNCASTSSSRMPASRVAAEMEGSPAVAGETSPRRRASMSRASLRLRRRMLVDAMSVLVRTPSSAPRSADTAVRISVISEAEHAQREEGSEGQGREGSSQLCQVTACCARHLETMLALWRHTLFWSWQTLVSVWRCCVQLYF